MSSIRVLFIEDEKPFQQYATQVLAQRGIKVFPAKDTGEADRVLQSENVDVIICDILMPLENGLTYIRRLRENGRKEPVIFLSALAEADVIRLGFESGAAEYMIKPFRTDELYQRILALAGPGLNG
jgi:DNA-binding response OmpR family regulator